MFKGEKNKQFKKNQIVLLFDNRFKNNWKTQTTFEYISYKIDKIKKPLGALYEIDNCYSFK